MAKTKKATKVRRKQCSLKGCRKGRKDGSLHCRDHQGGNGEASEPSDVVKKLSELDKLRFLESDTAMLNHTQEIKILDQEQRIEDTDHVSRKRTRATRVSQLRAAIKQRQIEQRQLLSTFGKRYGFDPEHVSIDDKTGVIQEHTPDG